MRLFTLLALCAVSLLAADVTGKWKGQQPSRDGQMRDIAFDFKVDGAKLTGNFLGPIGREIAISDGKVAGDDISFTVNLEFGGNSFKVHYNGKVSGDEIKMTSQREGAPRAVELTLKRATS